jgi:predicted RND superfamily exporter protein
MDGADPVPASIGGAPRGSVRRRLERSLGRLGAQIAIRPWPVIGAIGLVTAALLAAIPSLRVDTSFVRMLPEGDPSLHVFAEFRSRFGCPERAVLAVRPAGGLFQEAGMRRLAALQADLEAEVPLIGEIQSLLNARDTRGVGDTLIVEDLFAEWPRTPAEWTALERRARSNPLYQNLFVSPGSEWTLIVLEPDLASESVSDDPLGGFDDGASVGTGLAGLDAAASSRSVVEQEPPIESIDSDQMIEITRALERVVERHRRPDFEIAMGGGVVMGAVLAKGIERDFGVLLGMASGIIAVLLLLGFRSVALVALVLGVVMLALAASVGWMALVGAPLDVGTQILPAFLLAVGVGYAVHVLTIFVQRHRASGDKRRAVAEALEHSGLAILLTAITTMAGLVAFAFAGLTPLENIGTFGPVGVLAAAAYSLLLLPALLVVLPIAPPAERGVVEWTRHRLDAVAVFSIRHRRGVGGVLASALVLAALQLPALRVSHNPLHWLPEDSDFRRDNRILDEQFGGGYQLELLVRMRDGRSLREPEVLQSMRALADDLARLETPHLKTSSVIGLHDVVEEIHQALNEGDPRERRIVSDPQLVAQELLLFESSGSDDLEEVVDPAFEVGRMTVRVNYADAYHTTPFVEAVDALARRHLGDAAHVETTGLFAISQRAFGVMLDGMIRSYAIAIVVIGALMLLLIGRAREGLLAAIPNLAPIVLTLGLMGALGVPLGMFTLLVGNIALGLAVDDTIHFVHGYVRERERGLDAETAVRRTLRTTGSALFFTSAALVVGFSVFAFASLDSLVAFGLLASCAIALAFLCDVLVMPGLLVAVAELDRKRSMRAMASAAAGRSGGGWRVWRPHRTRPGELARPAADPSASAR